MGSVGLTLNMTGNEIHMFKGVIVGIMFNLLLGILLIPRYETIGAAISAGASVIVWNVTLSYFVYRKIGILPIPSIGRK